MASGSSKGLGLLVVVLLLGGGAAGAWQFMLHQKKATVSQVAVDYTNALFDEDKQALKRVTTPEMQEQLESTAGIRGLFKGLFGSSNAKLEGVAGVDLMDDGSATVWVDVRVGKRLTRGGLIVIKDFAGLWRVAGKVDS